MFVGFRGRSVVIGGVWVVDVGVILVGRVVIGHRDYSLTLDRV